MGKAKTLGDFRATGKRYDLVEGADVIGVDLGYWDGCTVQSLIVFDGGCYIEVLPGEYGLLLGRDYFNGGRGDMEARLFFDHYVSECVHDWTHDELAVLMGEWIEWQRTLKPNGLIGDVEKLAWLEWFQRMMAGGV
jgi:hypothetical protein